MSEIRGHIVQARRCWSHDTPDSINHLADAIEALDRRLDDIEGRLDGKSAARRYVDAKEQDELYSSAKREPA